MANTYIALATVTVGSGGAASIDFTSIPQTYTDLVVKLSLRNSSYRQTIIKFNNSSANFTLIDLVGNGASAVSYNTGAFGYNMIGYMPLDGTDTASTFGTMDIYVPNYAGSNNKSISVDAVSENNGTTAYATLTAGLWSQTTAINQLTILPYGGVNFTQYSSATIYGIKNS